MTLRMDPGSTGARPRRPVPPMVVSRRTLATAPPCDSKLRLVSRAHPAVGSPLDTTIITLSDAARPTGLGLVFPVGSSTGRAFVCDPVNHRINVVGERLQPLFSFGGLGSGAGQFREPSDVTIVSAYSGSPEAVEQATVLAVADCGNDRVQLFELDGAFIGVLEGSRRADEDVTDWWTDRAGAPLFRLKPIPALPEPSRLEWRPPFLDVVTKGEQTVSLNLEWALLPEFDVWLEFAPEPTLRDALSHFVAEPYRTQIPEYCLRQIAERLHGPADYSPARRA